MDRKEIAIQAIVNMAMKSEEICIRNDKFQMLFGSLIAIIITPMVLPLIFVQYKHDIKFAARYAIFTIHALMCSIVTFPLIFIDIAKVGTISMWYANKAYQMFKGENIRLNDKDGEYEFNEERYETWLRQEIASSK